LTCAHKTAVGGARLEGMVIKVVGCRRHCCYMDRSYNAGKQGGGNDDVTIRGELDGSFSSSCSAAASWHVSDPFSSSSLIKGSLLEQNDDDNDDGHDYDCDHELHGKEDDDDDFTLDTSTTTTTSSHHDISNSSSSSSSKNHVPSLSLSQPLLRLVPGDTRIMCSSIRAAAVFMAELSPLASLLLQRTGESKSSVSKSISMHDETAFLVGGAEDADDDDATICIASIAAVEAVAAVQHFKLNRLCYNNNNNKAASCSTPSTIARHDSCCRPNQDNNDDRDGDDDDSLPIVLSMLTDDDYDDDELVAMAAEMEAVVAQAHIVESTKQLQAALYDDKQQEPYRFGHYCLTRMIFSLAT
jgi:hypothetical protein